jgi:hypothetical protein
MTLEDLRPDASVRGVLPNAAVTVVSVQWHELDALTLVYRRTGRPRCRRDPRGVPGQPRRAVALRLQGAARPRWRAGMAAGGRACLSRHE